MKVINAMRRFSQNAHQSTKMVTEIREGVNNQSTMLNMKLMELIQGMNNQTALLNRKLSELNDNMRYLMSAQQGRDGLQSPPLTAYVQADAGSFEDAMKAQPLMFAHKTFNTSHPDYDATQARNFPTKIFNIAKDPGNPLYNELKKLIHGVDEIPDHQWAAILSEALAEAKTVPHAEQIFQRKTFVENYIQDLEAKHGAYYRPGWVNLDDALFLYWAIRRLKPKVIVQTGVCNGLSSAFMMLALVKNGPEGTLHVVDMPPIFDSNDPNWKVRNKVYGVLIPEGKSSGWLVPDAYQDRFEVLNGDAKLLLPGLLKKLGKIDMFYHDSDHTYDHMMFEFIEAKKYLTPKGVMIADDISWNASLWDFADQYGVPAYNYKGTMGIACFD